MEKETEYLNRNRALHETGCYISKDYYSAIQLNGPGQGASKYGNNMPTTVPKQVA